MKNNIENLASKLFLLFTTVVILVTGNGCSNFSKFEEHHKQSSLIKNNVEQLEKLPTRKGTVGTLLMYNHNDNYYVLLARERIDGTDSKKAGTFSDLGGRVEGRDANFASQMLRELKEETVGTFNLSASDLMKKAYVIDKSSKDRDIFYSIYLVGRKEFEALKDLNNIRAKAALNPKTPYNNIEKDLFLWLPIKKLLEIKDGKEFDIVDINSSTYRIKLRKFFVNDLLSNPDFVRVIKHLTKE